LFFKNFSETTKKNCSKLRWLTWHLIQFVFVSVLRRTNLINKILIENNKMADKDKKTVKFLIYIKFKLTTLLLSFISPLLMFCQLFSYDRNLKLETYLRIPIISWTNQHMIWITRARCHGWFLNFPFKVIVPSTVSHPSSVIYWWIKLVPLHTIRILYSSLP
jgi:hypothetical protein